MQEVDGVPLIGGIELAISGLRLRPCFALGDRGSY